MVGPIAPTRDCAHADKDLFLHTLSGTIMLHNKASYSYVYNLLYY